MSHHGLTVISALVGAVLACGLTIPSARADQTINDEAPITVGAYRAFLAESAPDQVEQFDALTAPQQERFIHLLGNPVLGTPEAASLEGGIYTHLATIPSSSASQI